METKELKWGFIGAGAISYSMADALKRNGNTAFSVWNRTKNKAESLAEKYGAVVCDTVDELLEDKEIDIIYISTTHDCHFEFIMKSLHAGKHVLCEKSITLNTEELDKAMELANEKNLILADGMTIWHMPIYKKLLQEVSAEKYGKVQMIQVNFGSYREYDENSRFYDLKIGGGALLDIGVYSLSLIRMFMSSFPEEIWSNVVLAPSGADKNENIMLMNNEGQMASATISLHSKMPKTAVISCENAYIKIDDFQRPQKAEIVNAKTGKTTVLNIGETNAAFLYEVIDMEEAVTLGDSSIMKLDMAYDVMKIMTNLRNDWGMKFPME